MTVPISEDLRERIVEARRQDAHTYERIASSLRVGRATVNRVLRIHRETGGIKAKKPGASVRTFLVNDAGIGTLHELLEAAPDQTLAELVDSFGAASGLRVSRATMGRAVRRPGYTRKKRRFEPTHGLGPTS
ncbi:MAG: transposase [Myxococcota bacterium]